MSTALYVAGALPLEGDQVRISSRVSPDVHGDHEDTLTVHWTRPCDSPGWAYLVGTWPNGHAAQVMVWLDRIVVRRAGEPAASTS